MKSVFGKIRITNSGDRQRLERDRVANLDDLITVIETVKSAVEVRELDAHIKLASRSLKAGS